MSIGTTRRPARTRDPLTSGAAVLVASLAAGLAALFACSTAHAADPSPFARARYTQVDGARGVPLNVVEKGDATQPAILFIHGYRQSHLAWSAQFASDLATRCRLVAFDLRGHGDSGSPWARDAYDTGEPWGDDVARVIRATGLVRPLVVAWSYGGNVAMDFLREHPDVPIAGLVLVGTTAQLLVAATREADAAARPLPVTDLATRIAGTKASIETIFGGGVQPALKEQFAAAAMRVGPFVDRGVAARLAGGGNADLLPRLTMPVTLIFGADDPVVPKRDAAALTAALPQARVVAFARSRHAPFLDGAESFDALLDDLQCKHH